LFSRLSAEDGSKACLGVLATGKLGTNETPTPHVTSSLESRNAQITLAPRLTKYFMTAKCDESFV
jgi:hypothetical protein